MKSCGFCMIAGSLNISNPSAESSSCMYVERRFV